MKKFMFICFTLLNVLMLPHFVSAYGGACGDNQNWDFTDGVLTISGTGYMYEYDTYRNRAPWTEIASDIKEIVIEDGVLGIAEDAFYSSGYYVGYNDIQGGKPSTYENVETVYIGADFEEITEFPNFHSWFVYLTNVKEYVVSQDNKSYCSIDGSIFSKDTETYILFPKGKGEYFKVPEGVKTIGIGAFFDATRVKQIILPESIQKIDLVGFSYCRSLEELRIPAGLTEIRGIWDTEREESENLITCQEGEFYECSSLKKFIVDENNPNYKDIDGVLFSKDGKYLYCYPQQHGVSYNVPENTQVIHDYAFVDNDYIKTVTFPDTVKTISFSAFWFCAELNNVRIPSSVTQMRDNCFGNCASLNIMYIPASVTEIGESIFGWMNDENFLTVYGTKGSQIENYVNNYMPACNFVEIPSEENIVVNQTEDGVEVKIEENEILKDAAALVMLCGKNNSFLSQGKLNNGVAEIACDNTEKAEYVKVFVWESFKTLRPLCIPLLKSVKH